MNGDLLGFREYASVPFDEERHRKRTAMLCQEMKARILRHCARREELEVEAKKIIDAIMEREHDAEVNNTRRRSNT